MLQALLIDRFKMKIHFEERPVTAYTLVQAKPKLKKADPAGRTGCKTSNAPAGPGITIGQGGLRLPMSLVTCQNITMAQFADQLQISASSYVHYPVVNRTGSREPGISALPSVPFLDTAFRPARRATGRRRRCAGSIRPSWRNFTVRRCREATRSETGNAEAPLFRICHRSYRGKADR